VVGRADAGRSRVGGVWSGEATGAACAMGRDGGEREAGMRGMRGLRGMREVRRDDALTVRCAG